MSQKRIKKYIVMGLALVTLVGYQISRDSTRVPIADESGRPLASIFEGALTGAAVSMKSSTTSAVCRGSRPSPWSRFMRFAGLDAEVHAQSSCQADQCGNPYSYVDHDVNCGADCDEYSSYPAWKSNSLFAEWESGWRYSGKYACNGHCQCEQQACQLCAVTCPDGKCLEDATCPCGGTPGDCQEEMDGCVRRCSPVVLDPFGEGFHLTNPSNGVKFRTIPGGPLFQMSWTDANWRNGWLALDRDGDGTIDDFTELFGNLTPQPLSSHPNGFLALAVFDDPKNGGNGNGYIDPGDAVYSRLRVWIDANHNAISEPDELRTLQELGIFKFGLAYHESPFVDEYGNRFRYKGSVWDEGGNERDACYDVFVQVRPTEGEPK